MRSEWHDTRNDYLPNSDVWNVDIPRSLVRRGSLGPARITQTSEKPRVWPCDDLHVLIAQRAFERYQARGSQNGCDLDAWLEAEREVLSQVPPM